MGLRGPEMRELTTDEKAEVNRLRKENWGADRIAIYLKLSKKAVRKHLGLSFKGGYYHPTFLYHNAKTTVPREVLEDRDRRADLPRMPFGDPPPGSGLSALEKRNGTTP